MIKKKITLLFIAGSILASILSPVSNATEPTVKITNLKYKYTFQKTIPSVYLNHSRELLRFNDKVITFNIESEEEIPQSKLELMKAENWVRIGGSNYNYYDVIIPAEGVDITPGYKNNTDAFTGGIPQLRIYGYYNDYKFPENSNYNSEGIGLFYQILKNVQWKYLRNTVYNTSDSIVRSTRVRYINTEEGVFIKYDSLPFNFEIEVPQSLQNQITYKPFYKLSFIQQNTKVNRVCIKFKHPEGYTIIPEDKEYFITDVDTEKLTNICTKGYFNETASVYHDNYSFSGNGSYDTFKNPIKLKLVTLEEYKKQSDVQIRVLQNQLDTLQRQTQEAIVAKAALAEESAKIEQRKADLELEYNRLRTELAAQKQAADEDRVRLTEGLTRLQEQKNEFESKQAQWQKDYAAQKADAEQKSKEAQKKEVAAASKVAEAEEKLRIAKLTDATNTQKLLELGAQLEKAKQDQATAKQEYQNYNEKLKELNKECETIRTNRLETDKALEEAKRKLAEANSKQQELAKKEETLTNKEKEVAKLQEEKKQNDQKAKQLEEQLKNNNTTVSYITKLKKQIEKQMQAMPWEEIGLTENTDSYNKGTFRTNKADKRPIIKKKATTELEKDNVIMVDLSNGLKIKKVEGLTPVMDFYEARTTDKIKLYTITEDTQYIEFETTGKVQGTVEKPKQVVPMTPLTPAKPIQPTQPSISNGGSSGGGGGGGSTSTNTRAPKTYRTPQSENDAIQVNNISSIPSITQPSSIPSISKEQPLTTLSVDKIPSDISLADAISYVNNEKIMVGDKQGKFNADATLTRAQVAQILVNKNKLKDTSEKKNFKDVEKGAWFYKAVNKTVGKDLFKGTSETTFSPNKDITLGEFAKVLDNQYNIVKETKDLNPNIKSQVLNKAKWNQDAVVALEKLEILKPLKLTDAKKPVTRGQVAVMLAKLDKQYR